MSSQYVSCQDMGIKLYMEEGPLVERYVLVVLFYKLI